MDMSSGVQKKPEKWSQKLVGYLGPLLQRLLAGSVCGSFCTANILTDAPSVVKAQILAGGRGKGKYESDGKGGVRIMSS